MTKGDVGRLLSYMASFDKRTIGDSDILAWHEVLPEHLTYAKAREAVRLYYQQNTTPVMPAQVIQLAKTIVSVPDIRKHETDQRLITIQEYGVERFWAEADAARAEKGHPPMNRAERRKWAKVAHVPVPAADEDLSGF